MEQTMKTKQKWLFALLPAMLFVSCEVNGVYKTIDFKLHGTWESTDTNLYSGQLVIGGNTITITGYAESQTPWTGNDARRSFRDFAKNAPLPCYSEEGKLFITTVGGEKIVPYLYFPNGQDKFLSFEFGDRPETDGGLGRQRYHEPQTTRTDTNCSYPSA
jgi:hypothetical protein